MDAAKRKDGYKKYSKSKQQSKPEDNSPKEKRIREFETTPQRLPPSNEDDGDEEPEEELLVDWDNGLFQCLEDPKTCVYGCFCPQCAYASARSKLDGSNWCFNLLCLNPCAARYIVRHTYKIKGTGCCGDVCRAAACGPCATCQLLAEVENRGPAPPPRLRSKPHPRFHARFGKNCCLDPPEATKACLCPQCAGAEALGRLDGAERDFAACCLPFPVMRSLVRATYKINEGDSCWTDILYGVFCPALALCQMQNEIARRGRAQRAAVDLAEFPSLVKNPVVAAGYPSPPPRGSGRRRAAAAAAAGGTGGGKGKKKAEEMQR